MSSYGSSNGNGGDSERFGASPPEDPRVADLGDIIVMLLGGTLAGLRDRLIQDGFTVAADLVADLVEITDDYVTRVPI